MLDIILLGTGGTQPLPERALAAACITVGGSNLLLDCGEGTQTAARRAGVNLMRADAICLTHYHGDHIFGLPGVRGPPLSSATAASCFAVGFGFCGRVPTSL